MNVVSTRKFLKTKIGNIGSLCLLVKNNDKYVDIIDNNISIDFIKYDISLSEKLYYFINDIDSPLLCQCGKHLRFIGFKNGYRKTCGDKSCFTSRRKKTNIEKYGVDNPMKSDICINKMKDTIISRYNGKHYMYDKSIQDKIKNTMMKNHGVEYAQQNNDIKNKSKNTWSNHSEEFKKEVNDKRSISNNKKTIIEKDLINQKKINTKINNYGSLEEYNIHIKKKIKETSLNRYNVDHFFKNDQIQQKRINTYRYNKIKKVLNVIPNDYLFLGINENENGTDTYIKINHRVCGSEFDITRQLYYKRIKRNEELCLECNKISNGVSIMEKELFDYIHLMESDVVLGNYIIDNKELDVYIPSKNIAIEFNGLYWHSELYKDKNYHLNKTKLCEESDIQLIHIWEDQWIHKQDIVKSMLLNKIGKTPNKIYGRKTEVKVIEDTKLISEFLDENHLQGKVGSKVKIGLYHNDELVSLMTFGSLRKNLGQESKEGSYELLRFCNKKYTNVVGGASKLFKHFIKNYNPKNIISYASRDHSNGNLYKQLGFTYVSSSAPNYHYIDNHNYIRMNRFRFRKDVLIKDGYNENETEHEIMLSRDYYRIYDSGNKKYEYIE